MSPRTIKFRLVAWYAGLLTGIFLLLCAILYLDLRHFLENDLLAAQGRRARQLANVLLSHVSQSGEARLAGQIEEWYAPESNGRFIRVTRGDGTLVYESSAPKDNSFDPAELPVVSPGPEAEFSYKHKLNDGNTLLVAALKFTSAGNPDYLVETGALLDPEENMLNRLFLQLAWGLPVAIGVIAIGGFFLVQHALRPVEQITGAAEKITQLNLSDRLPVTHSGDELEQLSLALNRMIGRLDDAFQNSKRFVADASHDLRTPLTILRGELESMVDDPDLDMEFRGRLAGLLEETVHLSKIVEQLFTLTRLDSGESRAEWTQFDLAEMTKTTAEQMSLLAEDKKISLSCLADKPAFVRGDRSRLKQVVVNLLDNAIKYTPANGKVEVRVSGVNGHAVLEVQDTGIGIPPEALPHVFERFYRVDQARSAGDESAGLGLSIVKAICVAHGAEVEAFSAPQAGSRFVVKLPVQNSETTFSNHELQTAKSFLF